MDPYFLGVIIGSLISGAIVGAIPAIAGSVKGKIGLALGGFFACLVSSVILGLILSVPVCAVFMYFIFKNNKNVSEKNMKDDFIHMPGTYCAKCGEMLDEGSNFCRKCGNNLN